MEALSEVLRAVKLTGAVFLSAEFRAPWCIVSQGRVARLLMPDAEHFIHYHYVLSGSFRASVEGTGEVEVQAGDILVFPHGSPHLMGTSLHLAPCRLADILTLPGPGEVTSVRYGGDGEAAQVICGFLACDPHLCRPILSALPHIFRVPLRAGPSGEWLEASLRHSVAEAVSTRPGVDVVLARLSEVLFVETLLRYIETLPPDQTGWLAGLREPLVGAALKLLHREPARGWTVDELAREVGCSRSVLAERFTQYLAQPPIQYLTSWRLALAASRLRSDSASLARVAEAVGYESEAAFNRAFKREFGVPPARWRRGDGSATSHSSR